MNSLQLSANISVVIITNGPQVKFFKELSARMDFAGVSATVIFLLHLTN